MAHCFTCGGHGFLDHECPECGMKPKKSSILQIKEKSASIIDTAKSVQVPSCYLGVTWDSDKLKRAHAESLNDLTFMKYCDQLDKIHTIFASGKIPPRSVIVVAPPQHSKMIWAYSCMQMAISAGLTVAPMLDSLEVKRLVVLAAERPRQTYLGINFEDYVNSDVLFITITKTAYREEAYAVIEDMLDKRTRRGLPTFFISRYNLETLSKRDYSGNFELIRDIHGTENDLKYPTIIQYWKKNAAKVNGE